jgi:hypothetical protein
MVPNVSIIKMVTSLKNKEMRMIEALHLVGLKAANIKAEDQNTTNISVKLKCTIK